ncbi:BY-kinase Wzz domain subunit [Alkalihalophilus pseudofirmus OF4]|uniref:BY-kinase Wzz domain subunit n=1 Tax=Alkalihalophilus pseudofirmus (strain ATCC BAA-2126 / JCM 17055 / OF4) TaxID=398511 RepID=D3FZP5_ALKPO|nr:Wzz/FepE/Etk N-terminal domain-containing protein [Alkalihalophilus pseudofirmus]ADC49287.1 BY-kinase Wzz domain subunit [Alkalihalophilus pseudofirmus OF4]
MEETISLRELYETLKKRIIMIITITVLAVATSGVVSYFVLTPMYQSSTQILVSQQAAGAASAALQQAGFDVDSKYIQTYNVIMKSPYILDQVIDELDLNRTHGQLNGQLNVSQEGQSQVVTIRVEDANPAMAVNLANATAAVFQREIANLLRVDNVVILAPAELSSNPTPVSPNPSLNMAIAFVVGLMAAVGLAFLLEYLDQSVRTEQDIEQLLEIPVLATIAHMDENETQVSKGLTKLGSDDHAKKKSVG